MSQKTRELLEKAAPEGPTIIYRDRLPLRLRAIANSEADVYIEPRPISEWDVAAVFAIVNALGGCGLTIQDGSTTKFNSENLKVDPFILARPGIDIQEMIKRLKA